MESLASAFEKLTSEEGQPESDVPSKVIASVAASRPGHTASAPEENMQVPQPEGQLARSEPPSLETLPVEIQIQVLGGVASLESLRTLVHTSPTLHETYSNNRLPILKRVFEHILEAVLVDAHATYHSEATGQPFSFGDYKESLLTASTERILEGLSLTEATWIASFHTSVVEPLTGRFTTWALGALSSSSPETAPPLSKTEKARVQRAIYRLHTICNMQFSDPVRLLQALGIFYPWEVEEILCIYDFAKERYSSVFFTTAWDLNQEKNPMYSGISMVDVNPVLLLFPYGDDADDINRTSLASILYQGLRVLMEVFNAEDNDALASVIERNLTCYHVYEYDWIDSAVDYRDSHQNKRRYAAYNEHDEAQDRQQPMPFEQDKLSSPPIAWVRFWNGTYSNLIGTYLPDVLRRWGYVMWDASRLENSGAMEYIELEYRGLYGRRGTSEEEDPREFFIEEYQRWESEGVL